VPDDKPYQRPGERQAPAFEEAKTTIAAGPSSEPPPTSTGGSSRAEGDNPPRAREESHRDSPDAAGVARDQARGPVGHTNWKRQAFVSTQKAPSVSDVPGPQLSSSTDAGPGSDSGDDSADEAIDPRIPLAIAILSGIVGALVIGYLFIF
jgi:hypothetical protein